MVQWKRYVWSRPVKDGGLTILKEINHCGEGGLYAELIRNRAFQGSSKFPSSLDAWTAAGDSSLSLKNLTDPLSTALPTSVNVKGSGTAGLINAGFWGIDVRPQKYSGSFYVKGSYKGSFTASLLSPSGKVLATTKVTSKSKADSWVQHSFTLTPKSKSSDKKNTFSLTFDGSVRLDNAHPHVQPLIRNRKHRVARSTST